MKELKVGKNMYTQNNIISNRMKLKKRFIKKMRNLSPHQKQMILKIGEVMDGGLTMVKSLVKNFTIFLSVILIGILMGLGMLKGMEILNLKPRSIQTPLEAILKQNANESRQEELIKQQEAELRD